MKFEDLSEVFPLLEKEFESRRAPVMDLVAAQTADPFRILVGTILSARTRDACTAGACERLFARATTPRQLGALAEEEIAGLIYPVGFYRTKAANLKKLPAVLAARFGGVVPGSVEALCELPGVGRKTANLVVSLGFGLPAICVDVHVHRISNRFGLVATKTPRDTETALRAKLPAEYWRGWNSYLVAFGQTRCSPRNPKCDGCPVRRWCDRKGAVSAPKAAVRRPAAMAAAPERATRRRSARA